MNTNTTYSSWGLKALCEIATINEDSCKAFSDNISGVWDPLIETVKNCTVWLWDRTGDTVSGLWSLSKGASSGVWHRGLVPISGGIVHYGTLMIDSTIEGTKAAYASFSPKERFIILAGTVAIVFFTYKIRSLDKKLNEVSTQDQINDSNKTLADTNKRLKGIQEKEIPALSESLLKFVKEVESLKKGQKDQMGIIKILKIKQDDLIKTLNQKVENLNKTLPLFSNNIGNNTALLSNIQKLLNEISEKILEEKANNDNIINKESQNEDSKTEEK